VFRNWLSTRFARNRLRRAAGAPKRSAARSFCPRLEQLESRTVPTTITRTSAPIFYNDFASSLTSAYASYQITNTDGVNYADVWATIGNFTSAGGPVAVTLGANAVGAIDLGPLANGQTKTAFFYLGSNADTTVGQTHTVSVFNGSPTSGHLLTSQNSSFTSVQDTIKANANKVTSVSVSPSSPTVGGTFTITVTGQTGTIGSPPVLDFTPAAYSSWRADALQLIGTTITFSGGNTGAFADTLFIPPSAITSTANSSYTAVYTFRAVGTTATAMPASPVAYISSGANVKHTDTGSFASLPPIQPVNPAEPTITTSAGPTVVVGSGTRLTDSATLAGGFNPTGTITFSLTGPGGGVVYTDVVTVSGNGAYSTNQGTNPGGFLPTAAGTYQWVASYGGDTNNHVVASRFGEEPQRVDLADPTITTNAGPSVVLGSGTKLTDSATLAGGFNPGGTITFTLTGPGGGVVYTNVVTVNGNGIYSTSQGANPGGFLPTIVGTYQWVASYSGDANNHPVASAIGDEPQAVTQANAKITTSAGPTVMVGSGAKLTDSATLASGSNPTGTITFTLTGPGGVVYTDVVTVSGNGAYSTSQGNNPGGFLPTAVGTYQWVASYSGDANNPPAASAFGDEPQSVAPADPTIATNAGPTVSQGSGAPLTDTATLAAGFNPTGTITFSLTGPGGGLLYTDVVTVSGNGAYDTSQGTNPGGFLPTATGTYQWVASYSGDADNHPVASASGDEPQTVTQASMMIATNAGPTVVVGSGIALADSATLVGGFNPTGTITFTLTGLGGGVVYADVVTVNGNGTYDTSHGTNPGGFLPTAVGTYQWVASYSGDANNPPAASAFGAEPQNVDPAQPTITTTAGLTVVVGSGVPLADTATLAGGVNPTGTITFSLTAPGGGVVYTDVVTVSGNGTYSTSQGDNPGGFLPTGVGTYQWVANYNGDADNHPVASASGDEPQSVDPADPTITTSAGPTAVLGSGLSLTDTATLADGFNPTGTITLSLTGPGGGVVYTDVVTVSGNGTYDTSQGTNPGGFLPTAVGTYQWVASYSGDANNHAVTSASGHEPQTVDPAQPAITTTAGPTVVVGSGAKLTDSATLAGGFNPTGTITFSLTGPGGGLVYTDVVTVSGNGAYSTSQGNNPGGFLPMIVGTYQWVASYSGDANNHPAASASGDEPQRLDPADPTTFTNAGPAVVLDTGVHLTDTAVLAGGFNPTGTITFTLTGPGGSVVYTDVVTVIGDGGYSTSQGTNPGGFLPTGVGTYQWVASYSGDADDDPVASAPGDEPQTVLPAEPTITTTASEAGLTLGGRLQDLAHLTGSSQATGTITFSLYEPGLDPTVDPATYTEIVTGINGDGAYHTTVGFPANATGVWHWVATYDGDANNIPASTGPLDEPVTVPEQADLAVTKTVDQSQVMAGSNVTYTVTVHNRGPDTATDVFVLDPVPPGLTFVSAAPSQGVYVPASGMWMIGTLANGATATLQVTATVAAVGPIVNNAEAGALQFDPDLSNNTATATVTGETSDISKRGLLASTDVGSADPLPTVDAVRADIVFINGVYRELLGRDAETAGLAYWMTALLQGGPRSAVARGVWDSPEHRAMEVDQFYQNLLHRPADANGQAFWVNALLAGKSEADVETGFLSSAEYRATHGADAAFVTALYQDVLGRAADPAGQPFWLAQLQGGVNRQKVIGGFLSSPEALGRIVDGFYAAYLGRPADAAGRQFFLNQLLAGGPGQAEAVGVAILASDEFFHNGPGS
jgi:uncharacterized repeat protein (TIGR01451 family)